MPQPGSTTAYRPPSADCELPVRAAAARTRRRTAAAAGTRHHAAEAAATVGRSWTAFPLRRICWTGLHYGTRELGRPGCRQERFGGPRCVAAVDRRRRATPRAQWFATRSNLPVGRPATCVASHRRGNPTSHTG